MAKNGSFSEHYTFSDAALYLADGISLWTPVSALNIKVNRPAKKGPKKHIAGKKG